MRGTGGDPRHERLPARLISVIFAPDFVIVGAPKCGTTALFRYLRDHPSIAMSARKEPDFWSSDVDRMEPVRDADAYRGLWRGASPGALTGEASTSYLRSKVAVPAIRSRNPEARFIVLLRNPSEMAHAFYAHLVRMDQEDIGTFAKAWALQEARASGSRIPPKCVGPGFLQYRNICSLGDQLERFCVSVPPDRRLIILFDDFIADTPAVYRQTLSFLGLPDDGRQSFELVNPNRGFRFPRLAEWHRSVPRLLGPAYQPLRAAAARVGFSPSRLIGRFNPMTTRERPELSRAFEAELADAFEPQIAKLERLLGRDLSHWKRPPANCNEPATRGGLPASGREAQ